MKPLTVPDVMEAGRRMLSAVTPRSPREIQERMDAIELRDRVLLEAGAGVVAAGGRALWRLVAERPCRPRGRRGRLPPYTQRRRLLGKHLAGSPAAPPRAEARNVLGRGACLTERG
jgi:hypothetical protein